MLFFQHSSKYFEYRVPLFVPSGLKSSFFYAHFRFLQTLPTRVCPPRLLSGFVWRKVILVDLFASNFVHIYHIVNRRFQTFWHWRLWNQRILVISVSFSFSRPKTSPQPWSKKKQKDDSVHKNGVSSSPFSNQNFDFFQFSYNWSKGLK